MSATPHPASPRVAEPHRPTMLPASLSDSLARQLEVVRAQHERDLKHGAGWVELPGAPTRKDPNAGREWPWQGVFPATRICVARDGVERRWHHLHETVGQRAVRQAALRAPGSRSA